MSMNQIESIASIVQSVATAIAFVIGGWWTWFIFIRSRQRYPKVKVSHSFFQSPIDDDWRLFRVSLRVDNLSSVLVGIGKAEMRLLRLKPWPSEIEATIKLRAGSKELSQYKDLLDHQNMLATDHADFGWPVIAARSVHPAKVEIEPNESETFHFDFVIDRRWQAVHVYSYVDNPSKRRKRIGWPLTSTFDFAQGEGK
jgi:hypothetical protein